MSDPQERRAVAEAAQQAWNEFVGPALTVLRADYMAKLSENAEKPMEGAALRAVQTMSLALRVTREVEAQMRALILDGAAAKDDIDRAGRLARMGPEERRYAGY